MSLSYIYPLRIRKSQNLLHQGEFLCENVDYKYIIFSAEKYKRIVLISKYKDKYIFVSDLYFQPSLYFTKSSAQQNTKVKPQCYLRLIYSSIFVSHIPEQSLIKFHLFSLREQMLTQTVNNKAVHQRLEQSLMLRLKSHTITVCTAFVQHSSHHFMNAVYLETLLIQNTEFHVLQYVLYQITYY